MHKQITKRSYFIQNPVTFFHGNNPFNNLKNMIKQLIIASLIFFSFAQYAQSQERATIYGLNMAFSNDSVNNVSVVTVKLKMKHIDMLTNLQVELSSDSTSWNLLTKSISIVQQDGNYYLEVDNVKHLMYGSLATFQFIVPLGTPKICRYAKVYGKQLSSVGSDVLYYQF